MKPTSVILALILGATAVVGTVWIGKDSSDAPPYLGPTRPKVFVPEPLRQIGLPAKAVVDNLVHDFGSMERHSKGEHVFTIRNEGEGTLLLEKGKATCKCTKFSLGDSDDTKKLELAPGDSIDVMVAWKVEGKTPTFHQEARVRTNDPNHPELSFEIQGDVVYVLFVLPSQNWIASDIGSDEPGHAAGIIGTRLLQEFEITSLESSSEFMTAKSVPLEGDDLKKLKANAAYRIEVTIQPDIPIGRFREHFTVKAHGDGRSFQEELEISTNRTGALRIVGRNFDHKTMTLNLGQFSIIEGKRARLDMFVSEAGEEEIEFHVVKSSNEHVKLTFERDDKFRGRSHRFRLLFEIPPGSLPQPEGEGHAVFDVESNHPEIKTARFRVVYQAY